MEEQMVLLEVESKPVPVIPQGFYVGKPRPTHSAREVLIAVVHNLLPKVMQWGSFTDDEESEVEEQLLDALEMGDRDGYELAKYLDTHFHWSSDTELAEMLNDCDFYECHRDAVKSWIDDNGIKPVLEVGREVTVKIRREPDQAGIIRSISDDGMYCVMIPAKGHVTEGLGTHGLLFPWEDVERWNPTDPEPA